MTTLQEYINEFEGEGGAVTNLEIEMWQNAGLNLNDEVVITELEAGEEPTNSGWNLRVFGSFDDPVLALFRDGEPKAGLYFSFRGVYQGGAILLENGEWKQYFASDAFPEVPQDEWIVRDNACASIVQDVLFGGRSK